MAKKKTKKKSLPGYGTPKKRRTLKDVARKTSKSGVYSNKNIKAKAKKALKYAKENPWKTAAGVVMMHPGTRVVGTAGKIIKGGAKMLKKAGGATGPTTRRALGTKVKGGGKVYKTKAQAEVAAGGTSKMKGSVIDKAKDGYRVNPSRGNVLKSPKTFAVGAGITAAVVSKKDKTPSPKPTPKPKAKVKAKSKGTGSKRKTYKSVESDQGKKVESQSKGRRNTAGANALATSTPKKKYRGKMDTQSGKMSTSRNVRTVIKKSGALVKKKAKTKRKSRGGGGFMDMVNEQRRVRSRRY